MSEFVLEAHQSQRPKSGQIAPSAVSHEVATLRSELDDYYKEMLLFAEMEPDEIFMKLSSYTARASFIRSQIVRSTNRGLASFRTTEIDPFISECDRQFKIWSRVFAVTSLDFNLARGQT